MDEEDSKKQLELLTKIEKHLDFLHSYFLLMLGLTIAGVIAYFLLVYK